MQADISIQKSTGKDEVFRPAQHTAFAEVVDPTLKGDFKRNQSEDFNYMFAFTASYNNVVNDVHYLTGNLRYSVEQTHSEVYGATVTGFPNGNMDHILFGKKYNENMTGSEGTTRALGAVATLGYSYDYRYSADFNIRIDGYSQFGKDNRFAPFWSAGLRWNMKKESWLRNVKWVDDVVLRASYGVTGTQGFSPYQSRSVYTYTNLMKPYFSSNATGTELVALGNSNLKWQQTGTWNVGLELSLLKGRFTTRAEYYIKNTKNSLAQITLAPSVGFASYKDNLGEIENKGLELNLRGVLLKDADRRMQWEVFFNIVKIKNGLMKLNDALAAYNKSQDDEMNGEIEEGKTRAPMVRYQEGKSINMIWANESIGIDPNTGEEVFIALNGDKVNKWSTDNYKPLGCSDPKFEGNFGTMFMYKGFQLNAYFRYSYGADVYNQTLVDKVENLDPKDNADRRVLYDRWKTPGDVAKFKAISNTEATMPTSRFIEQENYITLSSLNLSYQFDAGRLRHYGIERLKLSLIGNDVFRASTVKMERGTSYPFARNYSVALQVTF